MSPSPDPHERISPTASRSGSSASFACACAAALSPASAEVQRRLARALELAGDRDGAAQDYEAVLARHPRLPAALYNRGRLRHFNGAYEEAIADFTLALDGDPRCFDALVAASADHKAVVYMDAPATPERILMACEAAKTKAAA